MQRIDPPDIDSRDTADVVRQTSALAKAFSGWWSAKETPDAGRALIDAFAGMAQQVITRLNQMPNRHFLAYLRMLGLQPRPPRAAEVPLTFSRSAGASRVRVPAGTQVRGQQPDGTRATFYTRQALELLPSREPILWRAITYQPLDSDGVDHVSVDTAMANGKEAGYYKLFEGNTRVMHAVYLAADEILTIADATVQVVITFSTHDEVKDWWKLDVVWEYFSEDGKWELLDTESPLRQTEDVQFKFTNFQFNFTRPADMASCALQVASKATRACWIRGRLTAWPSGPIPAWCGVTLGATDAVEIPASAPEQILFNGVPIDTSKDYYPLGQQPVFNDSCTVVWGPLPGASTTTITLDIQLSDSDDPLKAGEAPKLTWETGSGETWNALDSTTSSRDLVFDPDLDPSESEQNTRRTVSELKGAGKAKISLGSASPGAVRIRLSSGNYGKGIIVVADSSDSTGPVADGGDGTAPTVVDEGYRPPILSSITVSISYTPSAKPICVTDNGEGFHLESFAQPVEPFWLRTDTQPAFYLAFGESLGQGSVSMYLEVSSLSGATRSDVQAVLEDDIVSPKVQWEYSKAPTELSASTIWQPLEVVDGTHDFTQSGFLQFIGPGDHARSAQFGSVPLYWLRARLKSAGRTRTGLKSGGYAVPPQGGLVLPNSVAAINARTIRDEVLGSSRQTPGQTFGLVHTPVLDAPELIVREPTPPPADEVAQLQAEFGPLAVVPVDAPSRAGGMGKTQDTKDLGAAWVRWKQVGSFAASGPQDRHYTLDHDDGTVTFGDGDNGKVPPAGKNSVVMACYQSGGGAAGNLPAGAICQMVSAVAHVATVGNRIASSGGADGEDSDAVMDWGPRVLRHRGRATARQDYEDLVRQTFPQIAKVSAITPVFDPTMGPGSATGAGHVLVVVVPDTDSGRPAPTAGLLQQIDDYLRTCMPPAVQLSLSGPDWLEVAVEVTVIAKGMDHADALEDEVERALCRFLNPLTGGFERHGWALGQMVHDSDLTRYLLALPGVDSVSDLRVTRTPEVPGDGSHTLPSTDDDTGMSEDTADQHLTVILVCSGTHSVTVKPSGRA